MWHEARRQEKKIRGLMVDYKRRADRRREFYEKIKLDPTQFLRMYGRPMRIHLDPAVSQAAEGPQSMMPWQGDTDNLIDRFDVRANLDMIPKYVSDKISVPPNSKDDEDERFAHYESYRCLVENEAAGLSEEYCLHQIYMDEHFGVISKGNEEEKKKNADKKAAIGYVYEDSTPVPDKDPLLQSEDEESDEDIETVDLDVTIDVDSLTLDQSKEINLCATQYGMKNDDFVRLLRRDKDEMEALKEARQLEEAKAQFSGRKSRKERRAINEKRQNPLRFSRPSYAARESPKYEPYKRPGSSSRSRSRSRSPEAVEVKFITSFGGDSDDGVLQGPSLPVNQTLPKRKIAASPEPTKCDTSWSSKKPKLEKSKSRSRSRSISRTRRSRSRSKRSRSGSKRSRSGSTRSRSRRSRSRSRRSRSRSRRSRSRSRRSRSRSRRSQSRRSRSRRGRHSSSSSRSYSRSRSRSRSKSRSRKYSLDVKDGAAGSSSRPPRRDQRSHSSNSSRSRSRSRSKSSRTKTNLSVNSTNKPAEVKRYRRESLSSNSELSGLESDEDNKSKETSTYTRPYTPRDDVRVLSNQAGKTQSKQIVQNSKLTPQERLKKKMQAQLSRQYKADKKERITKTSKLEQERLDREEEIRSLALEMRRREREKRHKEIEEEERELNASRSKTSAGSDSDSSSSNNSSRSKSSASPEKDSSLVRKKVTSRTVSNKSDRVRKEEKVDTRKMSPHDRWRGPPPPVDRRSDERKWDRDRRPEDDKSSERGRWQSDRGRWGGDRSGKLESGADSRWGDGAQNDRDFDRRRRDNPEGPHNNNRFTPRSRGQPQRPGSPLMSRPRPPNDPRLLEDYNR